MHITKRFSKKQLVIRISFLILLFFFLWFFFCNQKPKLTYPVEYQNILEHLDASSDEKQREDDIKSLRNLIHQTQLRLEESQKSEKQLTSLREKRDEAERSMYDAMDKALYVGKYICKVNTCQANPDDPNYAAFVNATNHLVKVKKELAKAKERYADAEKKAGEVNACKQLLQKMKDTQKQLENS